MKLNAIPKIKNDEGDYIVLTDYGQDGISVSHQANSAQDAFSWLMANNYGHPQAIVKIVNINGDELP